MELTDHQLKLLKICDAIRWGEEAALTPYNYHLCLRALGLGDPIITFEYRLACQHAIAYDHQPPDSPPIGPERSPWLRTYDVEWWRLDAIELAPADLSYLEHDQVSST